MYTSSYYTYTRVVNNFASANMYTTQPNSFAVVAMDCYIYSYAFYSRAIYRTMLSMYIITVDNLYRFHEQGGCSPVVCVRGSGTSVDVAAYNIARCRRAVTDSALRWQKRSCTL
eukprot:1189934-Prorocentrum_minimum.AAC.2